MKDSPCKTCIHGALLKGFRGSLYEFKTATRKRFGELETINYENGECGCREANDYKREQICLNNDFSEYEKFLENS